MTDKIAIAEPMTDEADYISEFAHCAPKGIPLESIIEYRRRGLSLAEIARLTGCTKANICARLRDAEYVPENLENFKRHRGDVFAHIQSQLINSLTPADIKEMPAYQRVVATGIIYDKERLERGKSTQNINVAEVTASIEELRKQADELRKSL